MKNGMSPRRHPTSVPAKNRIERVRGMNLKATNETMKQMAEMAENN
jgi:hypothetical protein